MEKNSKLGKVMLYQNVGFLVIIGLGFLDELTRLSSLVFRDQPFTWEFRKATLGMLLVLAVWFLVNMSTRRILDRLRYLEKFMRVCAWCHHINYKGSWISMEEFLRQGFDTPTTHGICPKCLAEQKAAIERAKLASQDRANSVGEPSLGIRPGEESGPKSHVLGTGGTADSVTSS
jgi:hypothetical protein